MKREKITEKISNYMCKRATGGKNISSEVIMMLLNYNVYRKTFNFLKKSEYSNKEKIKDYQLKKIKALVEHAYEYVPYYQKLFNSINLKPEDIKSLDDIQKIPFLTKKLIRKNFNELKSKNYPEYKFRYVTTGGSTGVPLGIYEENSYSYIKELAFLSMVLKQINCKLKDKAVILKEAIFSDEKFWKKAFFGRYLILSSFHLSKKNLPRYIEKIRKQKPKYIFSYSSAAMIIARYMKNNDVGSFKKLKALICLGENLYDWQYEFLKDFFDCRIINLYGHAEQVCSAFSCEKSKYYHFFPQYGYTELVDKDGKPITKEGEIGNIVGTGFKNFLFPLIRYKTNDLGVYTLKKCECGRNYFLLKDIKGRVQDFIVTKDDRLIPLSAINIHENILKNIERFQFYQEKKDNLILRIIKKDSYTKKDTDLILKTISDKIGKKTKIEISFVDKIPRTKSGKHKYLIQKLPLDEKFNAI